MIYLIGGAPRTGKSSLGQRVAASLKMGWISTDLLLTILSMTNVEGIKTKWNSTPEAITTNAEWFFPYLDRFVWAVSSMAENYLIEGVDFLPAQVKQLAGNYQLQVVFLGCSRMTAENFDRFPGHSRGYSNLPEELRRQIAKDIPVWSEFVHQECENFGYPYIDMINDFSAQLSRAESILTGRARTIS